MSRIVLQLDVDAPGAGVVGALDSRAGLTGWWTDDVEFAGGAGSTMTLGFPVAPRPFELRVDEVSGERVRWTSIGDFPPHWAGTTVTWTLTPAAAGTTVHLDHDGWAQDDGSIAAAAMTWAQLMLHLKHFAEAGTEDPLFKRA